MDIFSYICDCIMDEPLKYSSVATAIWAWNIKLVRFNAWNLWIEMKTV